MGAVNREWELGREKIEPNRTDQIHSGPSTTICQYKYNNNNNYNSSNN